MPLEKYSCHNIYAKASIKNGDDEKAPLNIFIENNEKDKEKYYLIGPKLRLSKTDSMKPISLTAIDKDKYLEEKIQFLGKVTVFRGKEKVREFPRFSDFFEAIEN